MSKAIGGYVPPAPPCCDLHGRNCEPPSELCCWECTEARHAGWTDERGRQRYGHPAGEECSSPIVSPLMLDNVTAPVPPPERAPDFHVPPGEIPATLLGATEHPGPPYVHTFAPPEPIGQDGDGNDIYPEPGPAWTLTEDSPYRAEIVQDEPTRCFFFEDEGR